LGYKAQIVGNSRTIAKTCNAAVGDFGLIGAGHELIRGSLQMQSSNFMHVLLMLLWCGMAAADSLSELPAAWQGRIEALPAVDISGAEPAARKAMTDARMGVNGLITDAISRGLIPREKRKILNAVLS